MHKRKGLIKAIERTLEFECRPSILKDKDPLDLMSKVSSALYGSEVGNPYP